MLHVLQNNPKQFQWLPPTLGGSMQHERDMDARFFIPATRRSYQWRERAKALTTSPVRQQVLSPHLVVGSRPIDAASPCGLWAKHANLATESC
jgi:hypothetical protein